MASLAGELGLGVEECARGIVDVAVQQMVSALHVVSVERGIDPRQIRSTMGDLPRLIEVARAIESQHDNAQRHDARRVPSHIKV